MCQACAPHAGRATSHSADRAHLAHPPIQGRPLRLFPPLGDREYAVKCINQVLCEHLLQILLGAHLESGIAGSCDYSGFSLVLIFYLLWLQFPETSRYLGPLGSVFIYWGLAVAFGPL